MAENMYEQGVSATERERLENFPYPHQVSVQILSNLTFAGLLDAGSGPDTKLAKYVVHERKANYNAFDNGKTVVDGHEESFSQILVNNLEKEGIRGNVYQADVRRIPGWMPSADIVHQRFVLMHLPGQDVRGKVLRDLFSIAVHHLILMEYNWRSVTSTKDQETLNRFVSMSYQLMMIARVDPFVGESLKDLVASELPPGQNRSYLFKTFLRPEGPYSSELIQLCRMQSGLAERLGESELSVGFIRLGDQLERSPIFFVPAEICVAIISK